ncbi:MAG: helix-turn-helix transcriptional regulator, partial [Bryobacterales bacterium]|nr:helix-turn-helix transcriptional regulator [Bryobacterales bacterium]
MITSDTLWRKLREKPYREQFAATQVKSGIPFQIRAIMKNRGLSQEDLAARAGLTQGVVSRAANPSYGNLTLNTILRIAAGLDVAFVGYFVPFSELANWYTTLSERDICPATFAEEDAQYTLRCNSFSAGLLRPMPAL